MSAPLKNFIGGTWKASRSGRTFDVVSPSSRQIVAQCQDSNVDDVRDAIAAAKAAFPEWSSTLAKTRSTVLEKMAASLRAEKDLFATLMAKEMGKPITEARGEVDYSASFFEWFSAEALRQYGETIPSFKRDLVMMTHWEPVGVVAAITPWNFPVAMLARKLGAAIAAGCTVVSKPAHLAPSVALELCRIATDAGLPAGVMNVVTSDRDMREVGKVLTTDPRVAKVTFTGSTAAGAELAAQASTSVKRLSMELGGNAPFIVLKDADIDLAVKHAIISRFRNAGQTCVCANRFLVATEVADEFSAKLAAAVQKLRVGDPLDASTEISCVASGDALTKVERLTSNAVSNGAKLLTGGERLRLPGNLQEGFFYAPTVLSDVSSACDITTEEIFGPVVAIQRVKDADEAVAIANSSPVGLAGYVFTRDLRNAMAVSRALEVGMVAVNDGTVSTETSPFGGVKQSGYGREGSRYGLQDYANLKATFLGFPN